MSGFRVIPVNARDLGRLIGREIDFPVVAYAGVADDRVLGAGALSWIDGRCWLEFTVFASDPRYAVQAVRQGKRLLRRAEQVGETEVLTLRDDAMPASARLLSMVGFELAGVLNDFEVWAWQTSAQ